MELASCSPGSQQQVVRTVSSSVIWQTADGRGLYYSRLTMTCHQPHTSWVSYAFGLPTASQLLGVAMREETGGEKLHLLSLRPTTSVTSLLGDK